MNHKELDLWKRATEFVTSIYKITQAFPEIEKFGLISQIRRASVSVPANVSEGAARNSDKEFIHFLYISLGLVSELETLVTIAMNLQYLSKEKSLVILNEINDLKRMALGLINHLKRK